MQSGFVMDALTKEQMKEADAIALQDYGLSVLQLMEMAGHGVARLCSRLLDDIEKKKILVAAGRGNNGGDAVVAAKYLKNWGAKPKIILSSHENNNTLASQIETARHLGIECFLHNELDLSKEIENSDIIIDGLLGYGLRGDPREPIRSIIEAINSHHTKVLSVDVPSGLDATSGKAYSPCIKASATASLAILKRGLLSEEAKQFAGNLYVIDIGMPPDIYARFGINPKRIGQMFSKDQIITV